MNFLDSKKVLKMKVLVKIGSNQVNLTITRTTNCQDLIRMALLECKIGKTEKNSCFEIETKDQSNEKIFANYCLFERAFGVERQVKDTENILQLLHKINRYNTQTRPNNIQLIIKFCPRFKKVKNLRSKLSHKIFKKIKQMHDYSDSHIYEQIDHSLNSSGKSSNQNPHKIISEFQRNTCTISIFSNMSNQPLIIL